MIEIGTVLTVIALFMLRIGIPLIALIALGTFIDRRQTRRAEAHVHRS